LWVSGMAEETTDMTNQEPTQEVRRRAEWLRFRDQDQAALLRALAIAPVRAWLVGHPWNGGALVDHRFGACRRKQ